MSERKGKVTMGGNPLTLTGQEVKEGDKAPEFKAVTNEMGEFKLSDLKDKTVVISSVPSLDTGVCSKQTQRFNDEAKTMGNDVEVVTVSMDLPFAQKRWIDEHDVKDVTIVSDHKDAEFGEKYGMLLKEPRLLARGVFIVGKDGTIKYHQLVGEISEHPDYDEVLDKLKELQ